MREGIEPRVELIVRDRGNVGELPKELAEVVDKGLCVLIQYALGDSVCQLVVCLSALKQPQEGEV